MITHWRPRPRVGLLCGEKFVLRFIRDLFNLDKLHLRRDAETLGDYCVMAERALLPSEVDEAISRHLSRGGRKPRRGKQVRIRHTARKNG
jgi:hypothetical protein